MLGQASKSSSYEARDLEEYYIRILSGAPLGIPRETDVPMWQPLPRVEGSDSIYDNQAHFGGI